MRAFLCAALALLLLETGAYGQDMLLSGAGRGAHVAPSFTAFNPAVKTGSVTFSNVNLTMSAASCGISNTCGSQVLTGAASGKLYATFTFTGAGGTNKVDGAGLMNTGVSTDTCANTSTTNCLIYKATASGGGGVFLNGATLCSTANCPNFTAGAELDLAIDMGHKTAWFRLNHAGNWNGSGSADPTTNTGGFDISALNATVFAWAGIANSTGGTHSGPVTANFGASAFTNAPSGFTGWPGP